MAGISSISSTAMQKNDTKQIEKTSKNYQISAQEKEKVEKFNKIISEYKDNNNIVNTFKDSEFVYATTTDTRLETFEEFIGRQLLTKVDDNSMSLYKHKLALIKALEGKDIKNVLTNLKEVLKIILGIHIYNQYCNFKKQNLLNNEDKKIEILENQIDNEEINKFMNLIVNNLKIDEDKHYNKSKFLVKIDHFEGINKIFEGETGSKERNIYNIFHLCVKFIYYAQILINKYF